MIHRSDADRAATLVMPAVLHDVHWGEAIAWGMELANAAAIKGMRSYSCNTSTAVMAHLRATSVMAHGRIQRTDLHEMLDLCLDNIEQAGEMPP